MILAPKPSESTKAHTFLSKLSPIYTKYNAIRFPKYEYEKKKKRWLLEFSESQSAKTPMTDTLAHSTSFLLP